MSNYSLYVVIQNEADNQLKTIPDYLEVAPALLKIWLINKMGVLEIDCGE